MAPFLKVAKRPYDEYVARSVWLHHCVLARGLEDLRDPTPSLSGVFLSKAWGRYTFFSRVHELSSTFSEYVDDHSSLFLGYFSYFFWIIVSVAAPSSKNPWRLTLQEIFCKIPNDTVLWNLDELIVNISRNHICKLKRIAKKRIAWAQASAV